MPELITGFVVILYAMAIFTVIRGMLRYTGEGFSNFQPVVTVIVAARNEEQNIKNCINSLIALEYPSDKLQIIIVDDCSTDRTYEQLQAAAAGDSRISCIRLSENEKIINGKPGAIDKGIAAATGEVIFITDADCTVPRLWIKQTLSHYTPDTGAVLGYTRVGGKGIFAALQNIDLLYLISLAAGMLNNSFPMSCIGNNMSFRKSAYLECGGYSAIPFSVTEDFALLMAMSKNGAGLKYMLSSDHCVVTEPLQSTGEVYHQKLRWGTGGLAADMKQKTVIVVIALGTVAPFLMTLINPGWGLLLITLKAVVDFIMIATAQKYLKIKRNILSGVLLQGYLFCYLLILPVVLLTGVPVIWKGRKFNRV